MLERAETQEAIGLNRSRLRSTRPSAGLHALRDEYARTIVPSRALDGETLTRERTLSGFVKQAYGTGTAR
jgi:hypothetical protein